MRPGQVEVLLKFYVAAIEADCLVILIKDREGNAAIKALVAFFI